MTRPRHIAAGSIWLKSLGALALVALILVVVLRPRVTVTRSLATFSDPWYDAAMLILDRDFEGLRDLLERNPPLASMRSAGPGGSFGIEDTLLHQAVYSNCAPCVDLLVRYGADVNASSRDVPGGREHHALAGPPLHLAIDRGEWEVAAALIRHGASLDAVDDSGTTAREILMSTPTGEDQLLAAEEAYKERSETEPAASPP